MVKNGAMARPPHDPVRPWEWLYDLVGLGMWVFTRLRFRVRVLGRVPAVAPGQVWVVTHRAETDVPLIGGLLWARGGMWRRRPGARVHFAARDDLFTPGAVSAGLRLPRVLARWLWPLSPGPWLPRVRAHPVRRPTGCKLAQLLAEVPGEIALGDVVGPSVRARFVERADAAGRPVPLTVRQAQDPEFARVLWSDVTVEDVVAPVGRRAWQTHIAATARDLRALVALARQGEPLVVFPEGQVSPDGALGQVGRLLEVLVRHAGVVQVIPVSIAYDPLAGRRCAVSVAVGLPIATADGELPRATRHALRVGMPVTSGQVIARVLSESGSRPDRPLVLGALAETAIRARDERRPVARSMRSERGRRRALRAAMDVLARRGDEALVRLAAEDRAIWGADADPA